MHRRRSSGKDLLASPPSQFPSPPPGGAPHSSTLQHSPSSMYSPSISAPAAGQTTLTISPPIPRHPLSPKSTFSPVPAPNPAVHDTLVPVTHLGNGGGGGGFSKLRRGFSLRSRDRQSASSSASESVPQMSEANDGQALGLGLGLTPTSTRPDGLAPLPLVERSPNVDVRDHDFIQGHRRASSAGAVVVGGWSRGWGLDRLQEQEPTEQPEQLPLGRPLTASGHYHQQQQQSSLGHGLAPPAEIITLPPRKSSLVASALTPVPAPVVAAAAAPVALTKALSRGYTLRRHSPPPPSVPSKAPSRAATVSVRQKEISLPISPPRAIPQGMHNFAEHYTPTVDGVVVAKSGRTPSPHTQVLITPPSTPPEGARNESNTELEVDQFGHLAKAIHAPRSTSRCARLPPSPPPERLEPSDASSLKRSATVASQVRPKRKPVPMHLVDELNESRSPRSSTSSAAGERRSADVSRPPRDPRRGSAGSNHLLAVDVPAF